MAKRSIPVKKKHPSNKKMVPWWNDSCENAVQERKKALKNLKRNPCEVYRVTYQNKVSLAKSVVLKSKNKIGKNSVNPVFTTRKILKTFGKRFTELREIHTPLSLFSPRMVKIHSVRWTKQIRLSSIILKSPVKQM